MSARQSISKAISQAYAALHGIFPPKRAWRVLMYHAIGGQAYGDAKGLFSLEPELFKRHLDILAKEKIVPFCRDSLDLTDSVAITFDDGYRDCFTQAAPLLVEKNMPFTVFVISDFVRANRPGFLSAAELRDLAALPGVHIGAHGASHVRLTECSNAELEHELQSSRQALEDMLGKPVVTMSYPYGAVDGRVRQAVSAAGYTLAACSYPGVNVPSRDPLLIARTEILSGDSPRLLRQKLRGDWDWRCRIMKDPAC